jgi:hypothetical protein
MSEIEFVHIEPEDALTLLKAIIATRFDNALAVHKDDILKHENYGLFAELVNNYLLLNVITDSDVKTVAKGLIN